MDWLFYTLIFHPKVDCCFAFHLCVCQGYDFSRIPTRHDNVQWYFRPLLLFLVLYKGTFRRGQGDQVHCASPPHDYEDCGKVAIQLSFMLIMWAQLTQNVTGDIYGTNMKSLLARKESVEDE
jgi:hypothetical protein